MESFNKCIISCKFNFKSSTLADELLLTQAQVERAARHVLNGEKTDNETLKNYSVTSGVTHQPLVIQMKLLILQDRNCFQCGITLMLLQYFSQSHHVMSAVFV